MIKWNLKKPSILMIVSCFVFIAIFSLPAILNEKMIDGSVDSYPMALFKKNLLGLNLNEFVPHEPYKCIHEEIVEIERSLGQPEQSFEMPNDLPKSSDSNMRPIRIHFDYSHLEQFDEKIQNFIKEELIPSAGSFFEEFLTVSPLSHPLKVDPHYKNNPCGAPKIQIPKTHIIDGIEDADTLFYITAQDDPGQIFLAYASICPQGKGYGLSSGRPTVGYFNMNLHFLQQDIKSNDKMKLGQWIWTTIHEMTHSLVFSPFHFTHFLKERNPFVIEGGQAYINAPSIVKLAQEHYGCKSIDKVPLENEGGRGTAFAHWERKVLGNELMTGSAMYDSVISKFTATMFDISGWYGVNYEKASTFVWGHNEGCDFFDKYSCKIDDQAFCAQKSIQCSYDFSSLAGCSKDMLSNQCQYFRPFGNGHCNYPDNTVTKIVEKFGGQVGKNTRCWNTDLVEKQINKPLRSLCFASKCNYDSDGVPESASFEFDGDWYECKKGDKHIKVNGKYTFNCPQLEFFCQAQSACPDSCLARGVCSSGKCNCTKGFKGESCASLD